MGSMLLDLPRVRAYKLGIEGAIRDFRSSHGRPPVVLDIGAGTGLLSLMAARAGASHVYALEMYAPLAELASKITAKYRTTNPVNAFGEVVCPISVIGKDSSRVCVSAEDGSTNSCKAASGAGSESLTSAAAMEHKQLPDMPTKADLCVFEIFDSALLGEGVIPALRDAHSRLLTKDAVTVPRGARTIAQLVHSTVATGLAGAAWTPAPAVATDATATAAAAAAADQDRVPTTGPADGLIDESTRSDDSRECGVHATITAIPPIPLHADRLLPDLVP